MIIYDCYMTHELTLSTDLVTAHKHTISDCNIFNMSKYDVTSDSLVLWAALKALPVLSSFSVM
jgi:hypothetical protein